MKQEIKRSTIGLEHVDCRDVLHVRYCKYFESVFTACFFWVYFIPGL